jgi:hypothetical protein
VPAASGVTVLPLTLQTVDEVANVTALPEPPPVAESVNGASVASFPASAANWIACGALAMSTDPVTCAAALYRLSPAWFAATTQVPAALAVSVLPLIEHGPETTL